MTRDYPSGFKRSVFTANSELDLPESRMNRRRPHAEPGFEGWPEKQPATIDGQPNKRRGRR